MRSLVFHALAVVRNTCRPYTALRYTGGGARRILLAIGLSALVVACGGSDSDLSPAQLSGLSGQTFAGKTDNPNMFAGVVTHEAGLDAYFCDGVTGHWFRGVTGDAVQELESPSGAKMVVEVLGDAVVGRLRVGDTETRFDLPAVTGDVLFRADARVGDQRSLGGWIVLPDGAQRGVISTGLTNISSTLSPTLRPVCTNCVAVASGLAPAAFTPTTARLTRNVPPVFTVVGLGDSYMSGEGAPVTLGRYNDEGTVASVREAWSDGLPLPRSGFNFNISTAERDRLRAEAKACHRGAAGLGLAVSSLQGSWRNVTLVHQTFACSGAVVANLVDRFDSGYADCLDETGDRRTECQSIAHDLPTRSIRPQIQEMEEFLDKQGLNADAVVMSIGGNDLGFGKIITDCLAGACADTGSPARQALAAGLGTLQTSYQALGGALARAGVPNNNVYITQHPNPLRKTAATLCAGGDFSDPLLSLIDQRDAEFATEVHGIVNQQIALASTNNRWNAPISSHLGTEVGHGICTGETWYNDTRGALRTQGHDLPDYSAFIGFVSSGMVHPNQRGHVEGYKPAYQATLDAALRKRYLPQMPTGIKPVAFQMVNGSGQVTLQWNDVNNHETRTLIRNLDNGITFSAPPDANRMVVSLPGSNRGRLALQACFSGATEMCSAETSGVDVEIKVPNHFPSAVRSASTLTTGVSELRLSWSDRAPSRIFSTVEMDTNGTITRRAVEAQELLLPLGAAPQRFRVAACNNLGCGPASPWTTVNLPTVGLPVACVPPQQSTLNGCRG